MISLLTDKKKNDLYLDDRGNLAMGASNTACGQVIRNVLRTTLGELALNLYGGIPYLEDVFVSNSNQGVVQAYLMNGIKSVRGVVKILDFRMTQAGNNLAYTARVRTIYGDIEING